MPAPPSTSQKAANQKSMDSSKAKSGATQGSMAGKTASKSPGGGGGGGGDSGAKSPSGDKGVGVSKSPGGGGNKFFGGIRTDTVRTQDRGSTNKYGPAPSRGREGISTPFASGSPGNNPARQHSLLGQAMQRFNTAPARPSAPAAMDPNSFNDMTRPAAPVRQAAGTFTSGYDQSARSLGYNPLNNAQPSSVVSDPDDSGATSRLAESMRTLFSMGDELDRPVSVLAGKGDRLYAPPQQAVDRTLKGDSLYAPPQQTVDRTLKGDGLDQGPSIFGGIDTGRVPTVPVSSNTVFGSADKAPPRPDVNPGGFFGGIDTTKVQTRPQKSSTIFGSADKVPIPRASPFKVNTPRGWEDLWQPAPGFSEVGVDPDLLRSLKIGAFDSGTMVQPFSGVTPRKAGTRNHPTGRAVDVNVIDQETGKPLDNYQSADTFDEYEAYAQAVRAAQQKTAPDLDDKLRWGGYFSGPLGKYGALDQMHFDVSGRPGLGMSGGSWDDGLTNAQAAMWPGLRDTNVMQASAIPKPQPKPNLYDNVAKPIAAQVVNAGKAAAGSAVKGFNGIFNPSGEVPIPRPNPRRPAPAYNGWPRGGSYSMWEELFNNISGGRR